MEKKYLVMAILVKVFFLLMVLRAHGQQKPQYTQYIMNNYILNPASGGLSDFWDIKSGFRNQWTGVDGAPQTIFLSVNGPVGFPEKRVKNSDLKPHHGIGGYIYHDKTGPISMSGMYLSYAYHLKVTRKLTASAGAFIGALNYQVKGSDLVFVQNPNDPAIGSETYSQWMPDGSLGLWLHSDKLFIGASMQQVFGNKIKLQGVNLSEGQLNYHYFLTGGYKIKLNYYLDLIPSAMIKYVKAAPPQFDLNVRMKYNNMFWLGFSYRHQDAVAGLIGVLINNRYEIGYSYDFTTSALRQTSRGSHEIIIGIYLKNKSRKYGKVLCPDDYWN